MKKEERYALLSARLEEMSIYEKELYSEGKNVIGGIDEVGRGPLAGPVVAACVVLPCDWNFLGLDDSKKLSEKKRKEMYTLIKENAVAIGIGIADNKVIDEINILNATKKAMKDAVADAGISMDHLLIDAVELSDVQIEQTPLIQGDAKSISIAAASIIAKVTRDEMMEEYAEKYPCYAWEKNKGYGTKAHYEGIKNHGICDLHRKSFLKNIL